MQLDSDTLQLEIAHVASGKAYKLHFVFQNIAEHIPSRGCTKSNNRAADLLSATKSLSVKLPINQEPLLLLGKRV